VVIHCAVGRAVLPEFAGPVDLAASVLEHNVAVLRQAGGQAHGGGPDRARPGALGPRAGEEGADGPPTMLGVGRLTPHKRLPAPCAGAVRCSAVER
jgi:hypothetical protein